MAGNSLRDIKRRIVSVNKTIKITSALKMVAAAKFKKNQSLILKLRKYSNRLNDLMANILVRNNDLDQPFFQRNEGKTLYVVLSSDRGLCGGFNQNIFRKVKELVPAGEDVIAIGNKGFQHFRKSNLNLIQSFTQIGETLDLQQIHEMVDSILQRFLAAEYTKVFLIYNEFKSAISQNILIEELLPIDTHDFDVQSDHHRGDYIYEPGTGAVIDKVSQMYLFTKIYRALLESGTAEQGSRMTAMDSATNNAEDLVYRLSLKYNRARQNAITTELTEIVAGAEGIK